MGKLIIIEGGDGSGKATQSKKLWQRLQAEGLLTKKIEFPNYASDSSALIKMYLGGEFGKDPKAVNPYAASTFYAVDRYASYKKDWGEFYLKDGIIISDRYTTSNMIHQAAKIEDKQKWEHYLEWLKDFEYNLIGLPKPDLVIYLDMPPEISMSLIEGREDKSSISSKDIHEKNKSYLWESYKNAQQVRIHENWLRISCLDQEQILKSIEDIHKEIYELVLSHL